MNPTRKNETDESLVYEIRVKGHLDSEWSEWFDNLSIEQEADGVTLLTGPFVDQAAFYGLLKRLNEFCLPLISFKKIKPDSNEIQRKENEDNRD
jgi:hypothetical protein